MTMLAETNNVSCPKLNNLLRSDPKISSTLPNADDFSSHNSSAVSAACPGYYSDCNPISGENAPYNVSPRNRTSPYSKSPWSTRCSPFNSSSEDSLPTNGLIGSLVREEGHVYSLAASGELLYTGSDSKNIRVWKNMEEYGGFKSHSGLVKAIIISGERIYTGHQDGKIRIWKVSPENPTIHKRVGTLHKLGDFIKSFTNPNNYVKVRHRRNSLWITHFDVVSCLSLDKEQGLLYSGSWDKTLKAWRIADSKCLESINAHDDVVNSVVVGFEGMVFTGSADGTVKVWKRETQGKGTKHTMSQMLE